MPFAYYDRLGERDKAIYRASDRVTEVRLSRPEELRPLVDPIRAALLGDDRAALEAASSALCRALTAMMGVTAPDVGVLAVRPSLRDAELHGLYTRDDRRRPRIRVWMRTAIREKVSSPKALLNTLLHEFCHHLDCTRLACPESYHTRGFYTRIDHLYHHALGTPLEKRRPLRWIKRGSVWSVDWRLLARR